MRPTTDFFRERVETSEQYEQVLRFWVQTYELDETHLRSAHELGGDTSIYAYFLGGELVGTVGMRIPTEGALMHGFFGESPIPAPPVTDLIEVSKLCIARRHRRGPLMKRVCEDVHRALVDAGRSYLAIAAPHWMHRRYAFIGFWRTGIRRPIPGVADGSLELMVSRQKRFGTYGLHVDPLRWNLFLRNVTDQLIATGKLRLTWRERLVFAVYRAFGPAARLAEFAYER